MSAKFDDELHELMNQLDAACTGKRLSIAISALAHTMVAIVKRANGCSHVNCELRQFLVVCVQKAWDRQSSNGSSTTPAVPHTVS